MGISYSANFRKISASKEMFSFALKLPSAAGGLLTAHPQDESFGPEEPTNHGLVHLV